MDRLIIAPFIVFVSGCLVAFLALPSDLPPPQNSPKLVFQMHGFDAEGQNKLRDWKIEGSSLKDLKPKVFLVGTYKTGKTTLAHWLMEGKMTRIDAVDNTRGLAVYETDSRYIIDTEGVYQPMENYLTNFVRDIIKAFVYEIANEVVIVSEKLYPHEISLIQELTIGLDTSTRISIIHNLRSIYTEAETRSYINSIRGILDLTYDQTYGWISNINDRPVIHYFVSNSLEKEYNLKVRNTILRTFEAGPARVRKKLSPDVLMKVSTEVLSTALGKKVTLTLSSSGRLRLNDKVKIPVETIDWSPIFFRYTILPDNKKLFANYLPPGVQYKVLVIECPGINMTTLIPKYFVNKVELRFSVLRPNGDQVETTRTVFSGGYLLLAQNELNLMKRSFRLHTTFLMSTLIFTPTSADE